MENLNFDYVLIGVAVLAFVWWKWGDKIKVWFASKQTSTTTVVSSGAFDVHAQLTALQSLYKVADDEAKKLVVELKNKMIKLE